MSQTYSKNRAPVDCCEIEGYICRNGRIWLPEKIRNEVLKMFTNQLRKSGDAEDVLKSLKKFCFGTTLKKYNVVKSKLRRIIELKQKLSDSSEDGLMIEENYERRIKKKKNENFNNIKKQEVNFVKNDHKTKEDLMKVKDAVIAGGLVENLNENTKMLYLRQSKGIVKIVAEARKNKVPFIAVKRSLMDKAFVKLMDVESYRYVDQIRTVDTSKDCNDERILLFKKKAINHRTTRKKF